MYADVIRKQKTYYELQLDKISSHYALPEYQYIQLRNSKDFMNRFFYDKIELRQLALAACMSRFHYIRLFQRVYGVTPRQYLKDIRINTAKNLIKDGTPVAHVCREVGYDSLSTFSAAFKKGTGLSPKAYQKLHNSNPE